MRFDTIIHAGILFLLVYLPLAFGGVTEYAIVTLETVSGLLLLTWLFKVFVWRHKLPRGMMPSPWRSPCYLALIRVPGFSFLAAFLLFVAFQLMPMPADWAHRISPHSYALYRDAAATIGHALPTYLPLSVNVHATEIEFFKYLAYGIIFFLLIQTISTPRQIQRFHTVLIGMGFLEAALGIISFMTDDALFLEYTLSGSFINKNHFAGYLELSSLIGLGILFTRFERPQSRPVFPTLKDVIEPYAKAGLWLIVLFVMICALLLSQSRGGQISFLCSVVIFMLLARSRRVLRSWTWLLLIFLIAVLALTLFLTPFLVLKGLQRFEEDTLTSSFHVRQEIWKISRHIFRDFPLLGSGLGTFGSLTRRYQHFRDTKVYIYTESDMLRVLAETGLIGSALLLAAGGVYLYRVVRLWRQRQSRRAVALVAGGLGAMCSLLIHGFVDFNLHIPANALTFTVIAALTYVTAFTRDRRSHNA